MKTLIKHLLVLFLLIFSALSYASNVQDITSSWSKFYSSRDLIDGREGDIQVYDLPREGKVTINFQEKTSLDRADISYLDIVNAINGDTQPEEIYLKAISKHGGFKNFNDLTLITVDIEGSKSVEHTRTFTLILDSSYEIVGYIWYTNFFAKKYPVTSKFIPGHSKPYVFLLERD